MNIDDLVKSTRSLYNEGSNKFTEVKEHMLRLLPFWVAGSITAIFASIYAQVFLACEEISIRIFENIGLWFLLFSPICFIGSWLLVEKLSPYASGSGIPQLMAAIELTHRKEKQAIDTFLNFRLILVKFLSSLLAVVGGGAIGREGPTLQISASIFHLIDKKWPIADSKGRNGFLLAGAASGLASAFNTPLGGIVYVVEELAKSQLSTFRTGVIHAVIFAGLISQIIMGSYLYFGYPDTANFQYSMIAKVIILASLASLFVTLFSETLKRVVMFRTNLKSFNQRFIFTAFSGLIFAIVATQISVSALGPGKNILNDFLFKDVVAQTVDIFSRFSSTVLTYSSGGAGGIFAPTLSLGGTVSSYFSGLLGYSLGPIAVLVGMTAGLAALTHSPLTSFILVLEMTDKRGAIFPLMIAAALGHGVSKILAKQSFYDFVFERLLPHQKIKENEK